MTTLEFFYKTILPLFIILLSFKFPRITLILICLVLKWWIAAIGVFIASLFATIKITKSNMTREEFEDYISKKDRYRDDS